MSEAPRYRDWADVPAGLYPESDLRFKGLVPAGSPSAYLELPGRTLALYDASKATKSETSAEKAPPSSSHRRSHAPQMAVLPDAGMLRRIDAPVPPSHEDARARISELLQVGCVLLDTETTGLGYDAEVIELAVLSSSGETLLDTLIRPQSGFIPARVSAVHGLTMADVEDAPGFADVYDELLRITAGKAVLAWNASFDERMVRQSAVRWGLRERVNGFECSMRLYALSCRLRGGRAQLERVARVTGVLQNEAQSHRALEDARISLGVLRHVAAGGCGAAGPTDPAALGT